MKKFILFAILIQFTSPVFSEAGKKMGFSFFAVGVENVTYEEKSSIGPFTTKTTVTNPILVTGGLFHINDSWDFSLRAESSLFPNSSTENWNIRQGEVADPDPTDPTNPVLTSADNPVQTDEFTMTTSATRVMSHYKITPQLRFLAGGEYSLVSFKRFETKTNYPSVISVSQGVVEETVGAFDLSLGAAYESDTSVNSKMRYHFSLTVDKPLYKKLTNTGFPSLTFNSTEGIGFNFTGGMTFKLTKNLHLGAILAYDYKEYEKEVIVLATVGTVEIPENLTLNTKLLLIAAYNF